MKTSGNWIIFHSLSVGYSWKTRIPPSINDLLAYWSVSIQVALLTLTLTGDQCRRFYWLYPWKKRKMTNEYGEYEVKPNFTIQMEENGSSLHLWMLVFTALSSVLLQLDEMMRRTFASRVSCHNGNRPTLPENFRSPKVRAPPDESPASLAMPVWSGSPVSGLVHDNLADLSIKPTATLKTSWGESENHLCTTNFLFGPVHRI